MMQYRFLKYPQHVRKHKTGRITQFLGVISITVDNFTFPSKVFLH